MVLKLPKCGDNTLGACLNESVYEICNAGLAHRANACIARGERHKLCIQVHFANVSNLEEAIVTLAGFGREDKR